MGLVGCIPSFLGQIHGGDCSHWVVPPPPTTVWFHASGIPERDLDNRGLLPPHIVPSLVFRGAQAISCDVTCVKGHEFGLYDLRKAVAILFWDILH